MIDNRQAATLIILGVLLLVGAFSSKIRSAMANVVKALFAPRLITLLLLYIVWLMACVLGAWHVGLWSPALLTETVFWFVATGFTWFIGISDAAKPGFITSRLRATLGITAAFEFFINVQVLSLPLELLLQSLLALLLPMRVLFSVQEEYRPLRRPIDVILTAIVSALVVFTIVTFVRDWSEHNWALLLRSLLLPIWLFLAALPLVYALAVFVGYGKLFALAQVLSNRKKLTARTRAGLVVGLYGNLAHMGAMRGPRLREAVIAESFVGALGATRSWRRDRKDDEQRRAAARRALAANAGLQGVDADGRRLDRREFAETKRALEWVAACHRGHYGHRGRYRSDLMEMLGSLERHGLSQPHGVVMRVSDDGQAWYAYRATVGGWVFAIGAAQAPPDEWKYDGPVPPEGFPTASGGWTDCMGDTRPEWRAEVAT